MGGGVVDAHLLSAQLALRRLEPLVGHRAEQRILERPIELLHTLKPYSGVPHDARHPRLVVHHLLAQRDAQIVVVRSGDHRHRHHPLIAAQLQRVGGVQMAGRAVRGEVDVAQLCCRELDHGRGGLAPTRPVVEVARRREEHIRQRSLELANPRPYVIVGVQRLRTGRPVAALRPLRAEEGRALGERVDVLLGERRVAHAQATHQLRVGAQVGALLSRRRWQALAHRLPFVAAVALAHFRDGGHGHVVRLRRHLVMLHGHLWLIGQPVRDERREPHDVQTLQLLRVAPLLLAQAFVPQPANHCRHRLRAREHVEATVGPVVVQLVHKRAHLGAIVQRHKVRDVGLHTHPALVLRRTPPDQLAGADQRAARVGEVVDDEDARAVREDLARRRARLGLGGGVERVVRVVHEGVALLAQRADADLGEVEDVGQGEGAALPREVLLSHPIEAAEGAAVGEHDEELLRHVLRRAHRLPKLAVDAEEEAQR